MIYLRLFWCFFQIGLFSIGGGYAVMPLIQNLVVQQRQWITMQEFADLITLSQMTPGPIALNASTFVGTRVAGLAGGITATVGCVTPSSIIALILGYLYRKYKNLSTLQGILNGLRPAVVGLIASAGLTVVLLALWPGRQWDFFILALFAVAFVILRKFKTDPIYIILGAGALSLLYQILIPR